MGQTASAFPASTRLLHRPSEADSSDELLAQLQPLVFVGLVRLAQQRGVNNTVSYTEAQIDSVLKRVIRDNVQAPLDHSDVVSKVVNLLTPPERAYSVVSSVSLRFDLICVCLFLLV